MGDRNGWVAKISLGLTAATVMGGIIAYSVIAAVNACNAVKQTDNNRIVLTDHEKRLTRIESRFEYLISLQEQIRDAIVGGRENG